MMMYICLNNAFFLTVWLSLLHRGFLKFLQGNFVQAGQRESGLKLMLEKHYILNCL